MYIITKHCSKSYTDSAKYCFGNLLRTVGKVKLVGAFDSDGQRFVLDDHIDQFMSKLGLKTKAFSKIDKEVINHLSFRKRKRSVDYKSGKNKFEKLVSNLIENNSKNSSIDNISIFYKYFDDQINEYIEVDNFDSEKLKLVEIPEGMIENNKLLTVFLTSEEHSKNFDKDDNPIYHIFQKID